MIDVGVIGAFLGGLLSFVSPCVLPLVPPYLCYVAGVSLEELELPGGKRRAAHIVLAAMAFVLGFSTVFVSLGATASAFGNVVRRMTAYQVSLPFADVPLVSLLAGLVIAAMGLHFLGAFRIAFISRDVRMHVRQKPPGLLGSYVLGLAFAFGWTPCIGPILAAILTVAGSEETAANGAFLLLTYSLGLGVPFLLAATFAPAFLSWAKRFRRHLPQVERAMGGFLVLTGILFITGRMSAASFWLLETFPALGRIG